MASGHSLACFVSLENEEEQVQKIADRVAEHVADEVAQQIANLRADYPDSAAAAKLKPVPANVPLDTKLPSGNLLQLLVEYADPSKQVVDICAQGFTIASDGVKMALDHAMECTLPLPHDNRTQWTSEHDIRSGILVSPETILPGTLLAIMRPRMCFRTPLESRGAHLFNLTCFIAAFLVAQAEWVTAWHSSTPASYFSPKALGGDALCCYMAIPEYLDDFMFEASEFKARIRLFVAMCTRSIACNANCGARVLMSHEQWDLLRDDVRPNSALVGQPQFPFCGGMVPEVCQQHTRPVPLYCQHPIQPGDILSIVHNSPFVAMSGTDNPHPSQVAPLRYLTEDDGIPYGVAASDDRVVKLFGDESQERKALVQEYLSRRRKDLLVLTLDGSRAGAVDRQLAWLRAVRDDNDNFDGGPPDPFRQYWPCVLPRGALVCLFMLAFSSREMAAKDKAKIFQELESFYVRCIETMEWPNILFELWLDLSGMMYFDPGERMYDVLISQTAGASRAAFGVPPDVMLARMNCFLHGSEQLGPPGVSSVL